MYDLEIYVRIQCIDDVLIYTHVECVICNHARASTLSGHISEFSAASRLPLCREWPRSSLVGSNVTCFVFYYYCYLR